MIINDVNMLRRWQTTPYWDFEWDYTQGKLENISGWATDITTGYGTSIISDGEKFQGNNTSGYAQLYAASNGQCANVRRMINGIGAMEVTFYCNYRSTDNNFRFTIRNDDDNNIKRITVFQNNGKLRVFDNYTNSNCTAIGDFTNNTVYTLRLEMDGTNNKAYIDGSLVYNSTTQSVYGGSNGPFWQQGNTGGSAYYGVLQSLKLKSGSI